jgi:hypothetical protein
MTLPAGTKEIRKMDNKGVETRAQFNRHGTTYLDDGKGTPTTLIFFKIPVERIVHGVIPLSKKILNIQGYIL